MQVDAVSAVAGDRDGDTGIDPVREGDRAGAGIVETTHREGDIGRLGIVDHVVGGVIDAERRHLGLVGVERDGVADRAGVVALSVGETQRRGDLAVMERCRLTL